jgi:hypothetical protein
MSTPPSESPRLPDRERRVAGDEPDPQRQTEIEYRSRIPDDEKDIRIPDPHE